LDFGLPILDFGFWILFASLGFGFYLACLDVLIDETIMAIISSLSCLSCFSQIRNPKSAIP
jgi:hypothetical protein